jgi:hypothetical protein
VSWCLQTLAMVLQMSRQQMPQVSPQETTNAE